MCDLIGGWVENGEYPADMAAVGQLVEDIASGSVEPNPYTRGSNHDACRFCPYGTVCHSAQVPGRRNYKAMSAQEFWEAVGKELKNHGR